MYRLSLEFGMEKTASLFSLLQNTNTLVHTAIKHWSLFGSHCVICWLVAIKFAHKTNLENCSLSTVWLGEGYFLWDFHLPVIKLPSIHAEHNSSSWMVNIQLIHRVRFWWGLPGGAREVLCKSSIYYVIKPQMWKQIVFHGTQIFYKYKENGWMVFVAYRTIEYSSYRSIKTRVNLAQTVCTLYICFIRF